MEIYHLKTFVTVAETGNLTRASDRLHISQPAISAHVKGLEEELGVRLFVRTSKGMVLTEEGRSLKGRAEAVLSSVEEVTTCARSMRTAVTGRIVLGLNTDPVILRIGQLFGAMGALYPDLAIELRQLASWEVLAELKNGDLDAGFVYGGYEEDALAGLALGQVNLVVIGPVSWEERLAKASLPDLIKFPWVWVPDYCPFHQAAERLFDAQRGQPLWNAVADNETLLIELAASGVGLSIMVEEEAREASFQGRVAVWDRAPIPINLSLVYPKNRMPDNRLQALIAGIRTAWGIPDSGEGQ